MQKLNAKEAAVLEYLSREIGTRGYAPSVRDICAALGYASTSTAQGYLDRLEQYGYIRREGGRSRSIVLCEAFAPRRIVLHRASEKGVDGAFVPDFLYCGKTEDGELPFAHWDAENDEYRIYVGERLIARLKPNLEN